MTDAEALQLIEDFQIWWNQVDALIRLVDEFQRHTDEYMAARTVAQNLDNRKQVLHLDNELATLGAQHRGALEVLMESTGCPSLLAARRLATDVKVSLDTMRDAYSYYRKVATAVMVVQTMGREVQEAERQLQDSARDEFLAITALTMEAIRAAKGDL